MPTLVLIAVFIWAVQDDLPIDDSDLLVPRREVADADNGIQYVALDEDAVEWPLDPEEELLLEFESEEFDVELARTTVAKNQELLDGLQQALLAPAFQYPDVDGLNDAPFLTQWHHLVRLELLRLRVLFEDGQEVAALDGTFDVVRFGRLIQASEGFLITFLVGTSIETAGLKTLQSFANRTTLSVEKLKGYIDRIEATPAEDHTEATLRIEYRNWCRNIDALKQGEPLLDDEDTPAVVSWAFRLFLLSNETRARLAEHVRTAIAAIQHPIYELAAVDALREQFIFQPQNLVRNGPGKYLLAIMLDGGFLARMPYQRRMTLRGTRLYLALRCFHREHDRLPASLSELVPQYIDAVPTDPFDGKPLRYSAEESVFYSVGDDLEDDGGTNRESYGDPRQRSKEPTYWLDFAMPPEDAAEDDDSDDDDSEDDDFGGDDFGDDDFGDDGSEDEDSEDDDFEDDEL